MANAHAERACGSALHAKKLSVHPGKKRCVECGASETPQWRQGPTGPQTLCNACGVRFSRLQRRQRTTRKRTPAELPPTLECEQQDTSDTNTDSNSKEGVTIALHPLHTHAEDALHSDDGSPLAAGMGLPSAFAFSDAAMAAVAQAAASGLEEDTLVCEAALNLLSMSSGQRQMPSLTSRKSADAGAAKRQLLHSHHSEPHAHATRHARARRHSQPYTHEWGQGLERAQHHQQRQHPQRIHHLAALHEVKQEEEAVQMEAMHATASADTPSLPAVGVEALRQLLPLLSPEQLSHLLHLCHQFEVLRQEAAAAQAAQECAARALALKQQEVRRVEEAAAAAAKALHEEARKLSGSCDAALQQQRAMAAAVAAAAGCARMAIAPAADGTAPTPMLQESPSLKRSRLS